MMTATRMYDLAVFAGFKAALGHVPRVPGLCQRFTALVQNTSSNDIVETLGLRWTEGYDRGRNVRQEEAPHALFIHDQHVESGDGYSLIDLHPEYFRFATSESNGSCGDASFVDVRSMVCGL